MTTFSPTLHRRPNCRRNGRFRPSESRVSEDRSPSTSESRASEPRAAEPATKPIVSNSTFSKSRDPKIASVEDSPSLLISNKKTIFRFKKMSIEPSLVLVNVWHGMRFFGWSNWRKVKRTPKRERQTQPPKIWKIQNLKTLEEEEDSTREPLRPIKQNWRTQKKRTTVLIIGQTNSLQQFYILRNVLRGILCCHHSEIVGTEFWFHFAFSVCHSLSVAAAESVKYSTFILTRGKKEMGQGQ